MEKHHEINRPNTTKFQSYYPEILVYHYKDTSKDIRYSQTQQLIDDELKTATGESVKGWYNTE